MVVVKMTKESNFKFVSFILFMLFLWINMSGLAYAGEKKSSLILNVTPERCVALRQGQTCYQEVVFKWRSLKSGDYCLFNSKVKKALRCWQRAREGLLGIDFQSAEDTIFILRNKNKAEEFATVTMTVAWVYGNKKRRRSSWRLF